MNVLLKRDVWEIHSTVTTADISDGRVDSPFTARRLDKARSHVRSSNAKEVSIMYGCPKPQLTLALQRRRDQPGHIHELDVRVNFIPPLSASKEDSVPCDSRESNAASTALHSSYNRKPFQMSTIEEEKVRSQDHH